MKEIITLALFFISLPSFSQAQLVKEKRSFVAVNMGAAAPQGDYASTDKDKGGYAKTGFSFHGEAAYYLTYYLGIGGSAGFFFNKVDMTAYQKTFEQELKASGFIGTYTGTVGPWISNYAMVGPYLSLPYKKATIDLRLLGGFMSVYDPATDFTLQPNSGSTTHISGKTVKGTAFSYSVGIGGRFNFSPKWALCANANYFYANPQFGKTTETTYQNVTTSTAETYNQAVSSLNISVGVAFQFVK